MTRNYDADYALDMGTESAKAVIKDYYKRSAVVLAGDDIDRDVPYGDDPLQKFSIAWPADRAATRLCVVFLHGGWWKAGNKEDRMFLAESLRKEDVAYASIGYPLAPGAPLRTLAQSAVRGVQAVVAHLTAATGRTVPVVLAGNSAGGHLASYATGVLAGSQAEAARLGIAGMCVASGLYDLAPMRDCFANEWLRLDDADVEDLSPIRHLPTPELPMMVVAGALEPQGFAAQQALYAEKLRASGARPEVYVAPEHDHFSVIGEFGRPGSPIYEWLLARRAAAAAGSA